MNQLPAYVTPSFIFLILATLVMILWIIQDSLQKQFGQKSKKKLLRIALILLFWIDLQGILSYTGYYQEGTNSFWDPLWIFTSIPLFLIYFLLSPSPAKILRHASLEALTYLHSIRIPLTLVFWWLYEAGALPQTLTYEGFNFDFLAGFSAPLFAYLYFSQKRLPKNALIIWNFSALALILVLCYHALFYFPFPSQKLTLLQPKLALASFPYLLVLTFIIPVLLFSHLLSLKLLLFPPSKSGDSPP